MLRKIGFAALLVLSLNSGKLMGADASRAGKTVVTTTKVYASGSAEADLVQAWIKANSPSYSSILGIGTLTVKRTVASAGRVVAKEGPGGQPVPLPARGAEGESITIRNSFQSDAYESWTYEWSGDGGSSDWDLIEYHFVATASKASLTRRDEVSVSCTAVA
ncbi:hypothetical protein HF319_00590 [Xanthomonas sp. Kuri4-1]